MGNVLGHRPNGSLPLSWLMKHWSSAEFHQPMVAILLNIFGNAPPICMPCFCCSSLGNARLQLLDMTPPACAKCVLILFDSCVWRSQNCWNSRSSVMQVMRNSRAFGTGFSLSCCCTTGWLTCWHVEVPACNLKLSCRTAACIDRQAAPFLSLLTHSIQKMMISMCWRQRPALAKPVSLDMKAGLVTAYDCTPVSRLAKVTHTCRHPDILNLTSVWRRLGGSEQDAARRPLRLWQWQDGQQSDAAHHVACSCTVRREILGHSQLDLVVSGAPSSHSCSACQPDNSQQSVEISGWACLGWWAPFAWEVASLAVSRLRGHNQGLWKCSWSSPKLSRSNPLLLFHWIMGLLQREVPDIRVYHRSPVTYRRVYMFFS